MQPPPKPVAPKEWPSEWKDDPKLQQLAGEHEAWLRHPMTQIFSSIVDKLILDLATNIGAIATKTDTSDSIVRAYAAQINRLQTITKILNDTPTFVKRASDH